MGRRLTASEETRLLQDTIRQAHEAAQALKQAIREARAAEADVINGFERVANREIGELGRELNRKSNEAAAQLNEAVERARDHIVDLLTVSSIKLDRDRDVFMVEFPSGGFDDQVPDPATRKNHHERKS